MAGLGLIVDGPTTTRSSRSRSLKVAVQPPYTDSAFRFAFCRTMPAMTIESASKLDAATRQLHMAIRLYFQDADPLAVHTLAGAAHGVLADLARHRGYGTGFQSTGAGVQTGQHAFVVRMVKEARVFLKHADRDPDAVLTFNTDWTDFLLFDAIRMHFSVAAETDLINSIFLIWLSTKYPSVLLLDTTIFAPTAAGLRRLFSSLKGSDKKRAFFKAIDKSQVLGQGPKPADAKVSERKHKGVLKLVPKP